MRELAVTEMEIGCIQGTACRAATGSFLWIEKQVLMVS